MQLNTLNVHQRNFILNAAKVHSAMFAKGFETIESLAKALGVHRNTILPYLSGQRAFPDCLDRMLKLLDLEPGEAIAHNIKSQHQYGLEIAPLISSLVKSDPDNAYILFGSRAKGNFRKYSDYDVGVYKIGGLAFADFSKLINFAQEWNGDKYYDVNLSNFTLIDKEFLLEIRKSWIFLAGNLEAWIEIQKHAGINLYE